MTVFTASDLQAVGLLAWLARRRRAAAVTPPRSATARAVTRYPGPHRQVTASQAAVIAAAPGRARQQRHRPYRLG